MMVMIATGETRLGVIRSHVTFEGIEFRVGQLVPRPCTIISATAMPGEPAKRSNIIDV
jgi:hypothetical protein